MSRAWDQCGAPAGPCPVTFTGAVEGRDRGSEAGIPTTIGDREDSRQRPAFPEKAARESRGRSGWGASARDHRALSLLLFTATAQRMGK
jgi:hypothetical protein